MLLQRPPSAGCHRIIHRPAGKCRYSGSLGRLSYLLQQKQQLLLKTAPFGIMVNRRKVHIFFHCKRRDHGFAPPVFADKGDALFMELTGVGFFTFSPLISTVPPDMRRMP